MIQTVKIATSRTLTKPLFFGYSSTSKPNYVYCKYIALHILTKAFTNYILQTSLARKSVHLSVICTLLTDQ